MNFIRHKCLTINDLRAAGDHLCKCLISMGYPHFSILEQNLNDEKFRYPIFEKNLNDLG